MIRRFETRTAVLDFLRGQNATPLAPLLLHEVTRALAQANFTQEEIIRALFSLDHEQVIDLMPGGFVRVMHFMKDDVEADEMASPRSPQGAH